MTAGAVSVSLSCMDLHLVCLSHCVCVCVCACMRVCVRVCVYHAWLSLLLPSLPLTGVPQGGPEPQSAAHGSLVHEAGAGQAHQAAGGAGAGWKRASNGGQPDPGLQSAPNRAGPSLSPEVHQGEPPS